MRQQQQGWFGRPVQILDDEDDRHRLGQGAEPGGDGVEEAVPLGLGVRPHRWRKAHGPARRLRGRGGRAHRPGDRERGQEPGGGTGRALPRRADRERPSLRRSARRGPALRRRGPYGRTRPPGGSCRSRARRPATPGAAGPSRSPARPGRVASSSISRPTRGRCSSRRSGWGIRPASVVATEGTVSADSSPNLGRGGGRTWVPVQFGVVAQDCPLQLLEGRAGLDAELLPESRPELLVGAQRLGLAPAPVEGDHPLGPQALSEGVLAGQDFELGRHLPVTPAGQVGFEAVLQGGQAGLFQPVGLRLGEGGVGHVGQGGAPPEAQRLPQRRRRAAVIPRLGLVPPPGHERLEAQGVNRLRVDLQTVTGGAGDHRLTGRPQGLAEPGDVDPQRPDRALGGIPAPQVLRQTFRRDGPVGIEHEQSYKRLVPGCHETTGTHPLGATSSGPRIRNWSRNAPSSPTEVSLGSGRQRRLLGPRYLSVISPPDAHRRSATPGPSWTGRSAGKRAGWTAVTRNFGTACCAMQSSKCSGGTFDPSGEGEAISLVDAGLVGQVTVEGDRVRVQLVLPPKWSPFAGSLASEIQRRVEALPEVTLTRDHRHPRPTERRPRRQTKPENVTGITARLRGRNRERSTGTLPSSPVLRRTGGGRADPAGVRHLPGRPGGGDGGGRGAARGCWVGGAGGRRPTPRTPTSSSTPTTDWRRCCGPATMRTRWRRASGTTGPAPSPPTPACHTMVALDGLVAQPYTAARLRRHGAAVRRRSPAPSTPWR